MFRPTTFLRQSLLVFVAAVSFPQTLGSAVAAPIELADKPLFSSVSVPGNLALTLSVEYPTATTPAYSTAYASATTYLGYFDAAKCYAYVYDTTIAANSYFRPVGLASNHTCAAATAAQQLWSGNYLNWASMQTLDTFRWVLTGGNRTFDTATETRVTKTYAYHNGLNNDKTISAGVSTATPFSWTSSKTRVRALGTAIYVTSSGNVDGGTTDYKGHNSAVANTSPAYANPATVYRLYVNVRVCDSSVLPLEENCVAYGSNYKPEGLMQQYAQKLRYSAFGYYNDSSGSPQRDGAILRGAMKYLAPTQPVPGSAAIANGAAEWDAATGVMLTNPDPGDATATVAMAALAGRTVNIPNSGVMNYLNKFGYASQSYKSFDPVGELYYAATRYFRNKGNVAAYSDLSGATDNATAARWLDGFPAITTWADPILYSCQKNFILGIGDVYSHRDANVPGSDLTSGSEATTLATVNADDLSGTGAAADTPDGKMKDVTVSTNVVGVLEGKTNLGSNWAACGGSGRGNTNFMAGMAYDMHTRDMRTDLDDTQTISTYWMDVHENTNYCHKNQYWLAAKYGGFTVPVGFLPYSTPKSTTTIPLSNWYSGTVAAPDTVPYAGTSLEAGYAFTTDSGADKRPDNYFPGNSPSTMKAGLTNAFTKIASEAAAATATALSSPSPKQNASGSANYVTIYDPQTWSGIVKGQSISYDATTNVPTYTDVWDARALLETTIPSSRKIVTCCTTSNAGLPFQVSNLASGVLSRTNYASFNNVIGVAGAQVSANYLAYLRGDRTKELVNGGQYRTRPYLLGDIVGSKSVAVAAPDSGLAELYNSGYTAFQVAHKTRPTVVYAGANDGMMHAFDGSIAAASTTKGTELFAYIPSFVYGDSNASTEEPSFTNAQVSGLASLGRPAFSHHYMVDTTPAVFDVNFFKTPAPVVATSNDWRTVLVGGLGKGGKGYYAIDVTDPAAWTSETAVATKILWEFGNSASNTASTTTHLGYSYGEASMMKTAKYGWVVVVTSGYNNDDGKGWFFFIHPRTGELLEAIATPEGSTSDPLNLAHHSAFVPSYKDGTADAIYAGDLRGNVWRLDVTAKTGNYPVPTKIAILTDGSGAVQPVTTRPLVEIEPYSKKRYLLVGTGRLLADSDIASTQIQSFYGIIDGTSTPGEFYTAATLPAGVVFPIERAALTPNTNLLAGIGSTPSSVMGWYFDFSLSGGVAERVNTNPTANNGIVAFAANLPNGEICAPSGTARSFAVNFATGQTVLVNSSGGLVASVSSPAVVTDITFVNVGGKLGLLAGNTKGDVASLPGNFSSSTGVKRLNWRVVPAID